jgi:putative oxidoreductase
MSNNLKKWGTLAATGLATLAFLGAGSFKLMGAPEMVAVFEGFGLPIWLMYFVGACEVSGAIGLWLTMTAPVMGLPLRLLAALGLAALMAGAIFNHVLHDPIDKAIPAIVLLAITLFLASSFRGGTAAPD